MGLNCWVCGVVVGNMGRSFLGNSGYLPFLPVGPNISCCCDLDCDVFLKVCFDHVVSLSCLSRICLPHGLP